MHKKQAGCLLIFVQVFSNFGAIVIMCNLKILNHHISHIIKPWFIKRSRFDYEIPKQMTNGGLG